MIGHMLGAALRWIKMQPQLDFRTCHAIDMPPREDLPNGALVIVGDRRAPKWVTIQCPCHCGTPLLLSLSKARRPQWSVRVDWWGRPSLEPSVRRTDGCRCHFWLRKGKVQWCADTGQP
ncbi:DUF6527 family protein [Brevundimonas nasdae]|uniref:DUF6527 family protein n=1 Tax=Brevundimonas nasdae TaxID=172043 RepID=UPI003F691695